MTQRANGRDALAGLAFAVLAMLPLTQTVRAASNHAPLACPMPSFAVTLVPPGKLVVTGTRIKAIFHNRSTICTVPVGLATYEVTSLVSFPTFLATQVLVDSATSSVAAGGFVTLSARLPSCAVQADAFQGPLLRTSPTYGLRLLGAYLTVSPLCSPPAQTPELGSGALFATGLLPLVSVLIYRRVRRRARRQDAVTA